LFGVAAGVDGRKKSMKKHLAIIMSLSLLITPVQSRASEEDFRGVEAVVMGGFLLGAMTLTAIAATVAKIIQTRQYRKKAAELNMEFNTYKAAVWYGIDPVKYQDILRAAQQHDLAALKRLFAPIELQVWGPHWRTERNALYNEFRAMLNRYGDAGRKVFVDKYPSFPLKALTHLCALYSAVSAIYNNKKLSFFSMAKIVWNEIEKMDALLFENPLRYTGPSASRPVQDQQKRNEQTRQQVIDTFVDGLLKAFI